LIGQDDGSEAELVEKIPGERQRGNTHGADPDTHAERRHQQKRENQDCEGFSLFHFAVSCGPRPL